MKRRISYFKQKGDSYVFAASMGLIISLAMVFWIVLVILFKGLSFFWPRDMVEVKLQDGTAYLGELWEEKSSFQKDSQGKEIEQKQIQLKIGNRDLYGRDFVWIKQADIVSKEYPPAAVTFERREYGNFYGFIQSVHIEEEQFGPQAPNLIDEAFEAHDLALENRQKIKETEEKISKLTEPLIHLQREISLLSISAEANTEEGRQKLAELQDRADKMEAGIAEEFRMLSNELERQVLKGRSIYLIVATADGQEKTIHLAEVVRFFQPNEMGTAAKAWHYAFSGHFRHRGDGVDHVDPGSSVWGNGGNLPE